MGEGEHKKDLRYNGKFHGRKFCNFIQNQPCPVQAITFHEVRVSRIGLSHEKHRL